VERRSRGGSIGQGYSKGYPEKKVKGGGFAMEKKRGKKGRAGGEEN